MTAETPPTADQAPAAARQRSRAREVASALVANRLAVVGLVILTVMVAAAVLGGLLAPHDPTVTDVPNRLRPPSLTHPFGTDELGRDVFSRVLVAARVALRVGVVAVGIALVAGVTMGLVAGFYRRFVDDTVMRFADMLFAFPPVLLALAILAITGPGITGVQIAIGVVYTPIFARVTRGSVLSVREQVYVRAARSLGAGDLRLLRHHILPNVLAPIIVQTSVSLAFALLTEAALSFVGVGVQPPDPSWGRMLAEGRGYQARAWWMAVFPGLAIFATVFAFNVVGDALRDALDPQQKSAIEARGM